MQVGFIFLHDENSTYDLNFINAAKEAAANLGMSEDQIILKTNVPEGQECYDEAADMADAGCSVVFADRAANNNVIDYYVYNFDIDSGAKISDDELLARAGSDRETAKSKLTDRVNAFFDEKIAESSAAPSDVFDEARSYSVSDENLSQAKYYLADNNILMAVYRYRWVAGAEYYYNQTGVYPSLPQF